MADSYIEIVRFCLVLSMLVCLFQIRNRPLFNRARGYSLLVLGFCLLATASGLGFFADLNPKFDPQFLPLMLVTAGAVMVTVGIWRVVAYFSATLRAEQELIKDQERLRDILHAGADGSWEWSLLDNSFEMSPSMCDLLGYRRVRFMSGPEGIEEFIHPDDITDLTREVIRHLRGETDFFTFEFRIKKSNGEYCWVLQRGKAMEFVEGDAVKIVGSATDITEHKRDRNLVSTISDAVSSEIGDDFFESIAFHLLGALDASAVCIGRFHRNGADKIETLVYHDRSGMQENFAFELAGSPYQVLVGRPGELIDAHDQASVLMHPLLSRVSANYFAGIPFFQANGEALGVLLVMFNTRPNVIARMESLLNIFGARVKSELERLAGEELIRESEERYRAFVLNSNEGIWRVDLTEEIDVTLRPEEQARLILERGSLGECNVIISRMYGYDQVEDIVGRSFGELLPEDYAEHTQEVFVEFVRNGFRLSNTEQFSIGTGDNLRWYTSTLDGIIKNGRLVRIWGMHRDITDLRQSLDDMAYQACHDALTGLPNRIMLSEKVEALHASEGKFCLFLMDLDRFKEINDTLGHQYGDSLLTMIEPRLRQLMQSENALLARFGGDEFAIVLPEFEEEHVRNFAKNLLNLIRQPFQLEGGYSVQIAASVGIARSPLHGNDVSSLLRCADVAMYVAKRSGQNFEFYNADNDDHSPERLALVTELGKAIRENQLVLNYQPKLDLTTQDVVGVEVLVRWMHPTQGQIPPGAFIPVAETTELIRPLTLWVLEHAIEQCSSWQSLHGIRTKVAVNLSVRNLMDPQLPNKIEALLNKYDFDPAQLELEITESAVMSDTASSALILQRINDLGVELSIDDFGTGYTSLAYLKRLPVQKLKIDLSFVKTMLENDHDKMIVNTITHLAHDFGLEVVAEGVESEGIQQALLDLGCDQAQGYHISRPLNNDDIVSWLKAKAIH